jgi:hypothetical protein
MYCVFQKARRKDSECVCHQEMIKIWGDKSVCPDLNTMQNVHVLKHYIGCHTCVWFYVLSAKKKFNKKFKNIWIYRDTIDKENFRYLLYI